MVERGQVASTQKSGINQPESGINQPKSGINQPKSGINQPENGINQPESGINQLESGINRPESGINHPEFGINQPRLFAPHEIWHVLQPGLRVAPQRPSCHTTASSYECSWLQAATHKNSERFVYAHQPRQKRSERVAGEGATGAVCMPQHVDAATKTVNSCLFTIFPFLSPFLGPS